MSVNLRFFGIPYIVLALILLAYPKSVAWAQTVDGVTQYSYDSMGRLECTAVRMNRAEFGSLAAGACELHTEGSQGPDRITRNVYDAAGQLLQVRKAVGTALEQADVTYSYTPHGKREYLVDANGNKARLIYDEYDRQVQWQFPAAAAPPIGFNSATPTTALTTSGVVNSSDYEEYTYDPNGNRTSLRKRNGQVINYSYDALNRVTLKDIPGGTAKDVYYGYDLRGLQTYARFEAANGAGINTVYDGFGRVSSSTSTMGGVSRTLGFQYDANGNRTRITHPDSTFFTYEYDGLNRPLAVRENGTTVVVTMAWDAQGRRVGETRGVVSSTYGYDAISRPISITDDLAGTGNDLTTGFGYNPANQIVSRTQSNPLYAFSGYTNVNRSYTVNGLNQYGAAGGVSFGYDANGNLTGSGSTTYTYDVENRLVQSSNGASLAYDPLGRLYETAFASADTTRFLYDGDQLTLEYDASGNVLRRYFHGTGTDDPLLWYEGAGLADRRSLQANHQGSVVSVADASGNATEINKYDEYGIPAGSNIGRFQYTGQAWIPELGMYHYKARIYSPTLGRFLQTDPIGYDDQMNLYAYVGNDPVNGRDPDGQECVTINTTTCGAAQGFASYFAQNGMRANQVRNAYNKAAAKLTADAKVERSALKVRSRAATPAPQRALIAMVRPGTGPRNGSSGGAARTNPAWTRAASAMGTAGKIAVPVALAAGAVEVATSDNKVRAAAGVTGSTGGGIAGGIAGAEGGALIGSVAGPPGALVGSIVGGILGSLGGGYAGGEAGRAIYDEIED